MITTALHERIRATGPSYGVPSFLMYRKITSDVVSVGVICYIAIDDRYKCWTKASRLWYFYLTSIKGNSISFTASKSKRDSMGRPYYPLRSLVSLAYLQGIDLLRVLLYISIVGNRRSVFIFILPFHSLSGGFSSGRGAWFCFAEHSDGFRAASLGPSWTARDWLWERSHVRCQKRKRPCVAV